MNNWPAIIDSLKEGSDVTVDPTRWNLDNPEYNKMTLPFLYKNWDSLLNPAVQS